MYVYIYLCYQSSALLVKKPRRRNTCAVEQGERIVGEEPERERVAIEEAATERIALEQAERERAVALR